MVKVILLFLLSFNSYSFYYGDENLPKCNTVGVHFYNNIIIYNYKNSELIGTEKSLIPMESEWSNLMEDIEEIFISNEGKAAIDSVKIEYYRKFQKNIEYVRVKKLSNYKNFLRVNEFKFNDGVLPKGKRPGRQYYFPINKNKEICYFHIDHYFADEQI